jgi:hypothetical protein
LRAGLFDDAPSALAKFLQVVLLAATAEVKSEAQSAPPAPGMALTMIENVIANAVLLTTIS